MNQHIDALYLALNHVYHWFIKNNKITLEELDNFLEKYNPVTLLSSKNPCLFQQLNDHDILLKLWQDYQEERSNRIIVETKTIYRVDNKGKFIPFKGRK